MHTNRTAAGLVLLAIIAGSFAGMTACGSAPARTATPKIDRKRTRQHTSHLVNT